MEWEGTERRSIPIHIINVMEERFENHAGHMERMFTDHTTNEMERYKEILDEIELTRRASADRHQMLVDSITSYMGKTELMIAEFSSAFPKTKDGKPDFHGHANAHDSWIEESLARKEFFAHIKKVVAAAAILVVGSWVGVLVWQGILHGPAR